MVAALFLFLVAGVFFFFVKNQKTAEQQAYEARAEAQDDLMKELRGLDVSKPDDAGKVEPLVNEKADLWRGTALSTEVNSILAKAEGTLTKFADSQEFEKRVVDMEEKVKNAARSRPRTWPRIAAASATWWSRRRSTARRWRSASRPEERGLAGLLWTSSSATRTPSSRRTPDSSVRAEQAGSGRGGAAHAARRCGHDQGHGQAGGAEPGLHQAHRPGRPARDRDLHRRLHREHGVARPAVVGRGRQVEGLQEHRLQLEDHGRRDADQGRRPTPEPGHDQHRRRRRWRDMVVELEVHPQGRRAQPLLPPGKALDNRVKNILRAGRRGRRGLAAEREVPAPGHLHRQPLRGRVLRPEDYPTFETRAKYRDSRRGAFAMAIPKGRRLEISKLRIKVLRYLRGHGEPRA
jgi:hypothetical protein